MLWPQRSQICILFFFFFPHLHKMMQILLRIKCPRGFLSVLQHHWHSQQAEIIFSLLLHTGDNFYFSPGNSKLVKLYNFYFS